MPLWILALLISILKAIPVGWRLVAFLVKLLNINIFVAGAFMVIGVPALTLVQYYYMPRACYELPAAASTRAAAGNMSTAKTRKCSPPSTSGSRS